MSANRRLELRNAQKVHLKIGRWHYLIKKWQNKHCSTLCQTLQETVTPGSNTRRTATITTATWHAKPSLVRLPWIV